MHLKYSLLYIIRYINKLWIFRRKRYNMHFLSRFSDVNQQSFVNERITVGTKNDNPEKPSNLLSGPTNVRHFRKISVFHMSLFMKEIYSWSKPNQCSCRIIVFKVQSAIHRFNWSWNDAARLQSSRWVFFINSLTLVLFSCKIKPVVNEAQVITTERSRLRIRLRMHWCALWNRGLFRNRLIVWLYRN